MINNYGPLCNLVNYEFMMCILSTLQEIKSKIIPIYKVCFKKWSLTHYYLLVGFNNSVTKPR